MVSLHLRDQLLSTLNRDESIEPMTPGTFALTLNPAARRSGHISVASRASSAEQAWNALSALWQVFGFSKDFCMSGFRVGCVYTRNATLLQAMSNVAYFPAASNLTQHALTALLEDTQFIVHHRPVPPPRAAHLFDASCSHSARLRQSCHLVQMVQY